jgi:hypothetical protein
MVKAAAAAAARRPVNHNPLVFWDRHNFVIALKSLVSAIRG